MSDRKRPLDEDRFLGSHFSSGGRLGVDGTESVRGAGPEALKHVVLRILQDGETVVKALKRLRPPPKQAAGTRKRRQIGGRDRQGQQEAKAAAHAFLTELEGPDTAVQEQEAENRRLFNELTEAAGELLDLGFEDVYQDTRESLAASLGRGQMDQHKGTYIWHDDGLSARQQHDALDNVTTFKGLPASASRPGAAEVKEAPPSSGRAGSQGAAAAAGGAVSYHTAVPHSYAAPASTATMLHDSGQRPSAPGAAGSAPLGRPPPAIPKLAPLPPAPSQRAPPEAADQPLPPPPTVPPAHLGPGGAGAHPAQPPTYTPPYHDASQHQYWQPPPQQQPAGPPHAHGGPPGAPPAWAGYQHQAPPHAPGAWPQPGWPQPAWPQPGWPQHPPVPHQQHAPQQHPPPGQPYWAGHAPG